MEESATAAVMLLAVLTLLPALLALAAGVMFPPFGNIRRSRRPGRALGLDRRPRGARPA